MDLFYPLDVFAHWLVGSVFQLDPLSRFGAAIHFFVYDSLKIVLLLLIINYLMAVIRHFMPLEQMRTFLTSRKWYGLDHVMASLFGAITPFCSCSSIPLFVGFVGAGIPLGVTFSFLITSPLINEAALVMFISLFGWKITVLYVLAGMSIGVLGGILLGALRMERYLEPFVLSTKISNALPRKQHRTLYQLHQSFWRQTWEITLTLIPFVLAGIAIGAVIHGFVPAGYFQPYITSTNIFAVPLATLLAVPLYSNATGVIPIIQALIAKGIPLGTALAFMMAVVGLSLPEFLILKKVMKVPLLVLFFVVVTTGIIIMGYLFNLFELSVR